MILKYPKLKKEKISVDFLCACGVFDFLKDLTEIVNFIISDEQTFGLYPFSFIIIFDIVLQFVGSFFY